MTAVELRAVGLEPDPAGNVLRMTYEFAAEPQSAIANTFNIVCDNNVASY